MRFNIILKYIGFVLLLDAIFMLLSALVSLAYSADSALFPLLLSAGLTGTLGIFPFIFVRERGELNTKESYVIIVGAWLVSCVVGMFPYLLWGGEFSFCNAWYEAVSGFTATGSTILNNVEALPHGLLFWRSSTSWLGGVGVVMFTLLVLPTLGRRYKSSISKTELSPLARENFRYRTQKIVMILLVVYVGMTIMESVLLRIAGMSWFDGINTAMSNIATGGFSIKNNSIAYWNSGWIDAIVTFFMVVAGMHFGLIFATVTGKSKNIFNTEVSRYYLTALAVITLIITVTLWLNHCYGTFWEALRHSSFQVAAYGSTTGFATADANLWPPLAMVLLIFLSIQCGCAGSTSGGLKADRIWLALKAVRVGLQRQRHPNAVIHVRIDNVVQEEAVVNGVLLFIFIYLVTMLLGTVTLTIAGEDITTAFTASVAGIGNVGTGFGKIGSMNNYAGMSTFVKSFQPLLMLLGRLEIFGLIHFFMLKWWR